MLADELDYVIGVDTHRDQHVLAVVVAPTGAVVAQQSVRADRGGYEAALRFARRYAPGGRIWAIEGAGHYGAGLTRFLTGNGETAVEVGHGGRGLRRSRNDAFVVVYGSHLYWTNGAAGANSIGRANLDGSGANVHFISGLNGVVSIAIGGGYIYWTIWNPHGVARSGTVIGRAKIDGSEINRRFIAGAKGPYGIAIGP